MTMATRNTKRSAKDDQQIDAAVALFEKSRDDYEHFAQALQDCLLKDSELGSMIHFIRYRVKTTDSLRAKLKRLSDGEQRDLMDAAYPLARVPGLAGLRIIHLHTDQIKLMHPQILAVLNANCYRIIGAPVAYCWDVEYKKLFEDVGLRAEEADSMYTTVHYDIQSSQKTPMICELQVRSLADEVWGEVSHRVNYPIESPSEACRDQLKVLARLTSGCGRLVDSIFKTHGEATAT